MGDESEEVVVGGPVSRGSITGGHARTARGGWIDCALQIYVEACIGKRLLEHCPASDFDAKFDI